MTIVGRGGRGDSGVAMTNSKAEGDDGLSASSADQVRWFEVSPEAVGRQAPGGPEGRGPTREKPPQTGVFYNLVPGRGRRSEETTSELQSLLRNTYSVFFLKQKQQPSKYH